MTKTWLLLFKCKIMQQLTIWIYFPRTLNNKDENCLKQSLFYLKIVGNDAKKEKQLNEISNKLST